MMATLILHSAKQIEQQFHTGEEPVMVLCSDVNLYVCKYMRSSATAYKLACEFIGAKLAKAWQLNTPDIALVNIRPAHWEGINLSHSLSAPSIGYRWLDGMVDITPSTYAKVLAKEEVLRQLMQIALFVRMSQAVATEITSELPQEWKVPSDTINEKLQQLFDRQWTEAAWQNFMDCLYENIE